MTPSRATPRLHDWLAGHAAPAPLLSALQAAAATLPHAPEETLAVHVLAVLQPLRADPEVLAAAALHLWPALRAAVAHDVLGPRVPPLL
ncbi:hypothetical protein, partial [Arenimonas sp.]|uniref:hypothetical protein n=1 Tax=Arenimonas sp. TaxID=1872635 RepID=UPI0025BF2B86